MKLLSKSLGKNGNIYFVEGDSDRTYKIFYDKEFNPRNTLILEEKILEQFNSSTKPAEARIIDYQPNKVIIKTKSDSDKLLFLSDTYYPGWQAYVDGNEKKIIELNGPNKGLYIGPGVWREMYDFDKSAVLLVLASEYYNENDYIRDYKEFLLNI